MVDKPGQIPTFGGIDDGVLINPEQIAASNALLLVSLLSHVSDDLKRRKRLTRLLFTTILSPGKHLQWAECPSEPLGQLRGYNHGKSGLLPFVTNDRCLMNNFPSLAVSLCSFYLSDDLTHILNHHLICCYRLHCKQAPLMDVTPTERNPLLSELIQEYVVVVVHGKIRT